MEVLRAVAADQDAFFGENEAKKKYFFKEFVSILTKVVSVNIRV